MEEEKKPISYYSHSREEMLDFVPSSAKKIIDIGCGEAEFAAKLKERGGLEIWGIELDLIAAEKAKNKLDKLLIGGALENIEKMPDKYFDCIVFNDILEHLADPYSILKKIKTKLSPGGVVVCSIPNVRHISVLKELIIDGQWEYKDAGILDKTHLRFFTKKSVEKTFNELGFKITSTTGINATNWKKFFPILAIIFILIPEIKYPQFAYVANVKN